VILDASRHDVIANSCCDGDEDICQPKQAAGVDAKSFVIDGPCTDIARRLWTRRRVHKFVPEPWNLVTCEVAHRNVTSQINFVK
jgi:hypothetical protein